MAISMSKYVAITSGVGGAAAAAKKDMIARILTTNVLAPFNKVLEFGNDATAALKNVGEYFGTTSEEYKFASKYFGWVSPMITQAKKISFTRWAKTALSATIVPTIKAPALSVFSTIDDGAMGFVIDGTTYDLASLDFTSATSLSDVATAIQTALRAESNTHLTDCTVEFVANEGFRFTSGNAGDCVIGHSIKAETGTDIAELLGWTLNKSPILSNGSNVETLTDALTRTSDISDNYASLICLDTLTVAEHVEVAEWTKAQNYKLVYHALCNEGNKVEMADSLKGYECVALTYDNVNTLATFMPACIAAATPYDRLNGTINFMYRQFDTETPAVDNDTLSNELDAKRINYLGETQKAGKGIAFYQDGFDMSGQQLQVAYGEIYLKDAITTACINLQVAAPNVPASERGDAQFRSIVIPEIESCLVNGIITTGKPLSSTQKAYIDTLAGEGAWRQVQQNGYILISDVVTFDDNGTTKWKWDYIVLYSKGDSLVKVTGSDVLI